MISATDAIGAQRIYETAIIHTTVGDIHLQLFAKECPKTVENFCVHSKNGYYNNHIFHRAIKGFMIQTGDPLGNLQIYCPIIPSRSQDFYSNSCSCEIPKTEIFLKNYVQSSRNSFQFSTIF